MFVLAFSVWAILIASPSPDCNGEVAKIVQRIRNAEVAFRAKKIRTELVDRSVKDALLGLERLGRSRSKCLGASALEEFRTTYCRLIKAANDGGFTDDRLVAALFPLVRRGSEPDAQQVCPTPISAGDAETNGSGASSSGAASPSAGDAETSASGAGSSSTASSGTDLQDKGSFSAAASGVHDTQPAGALPEEKETAPILMPEPAPAPSQATRRPGRVVGLGFAVGTILGGIGLTIPYLVNGIRANRRAEELGARCTGPAGDSESCGSLKSSAMAAFQATEARRGMAVAGVVVALVGISATIPLAIAVHKKRVAPSPNVSFLASPSSLELLVRIPLGASRR